MKIVKWFLALFAFWGLSSCVNDGGDLQIYDSSAKDALICLPDTSHVVSFEQAFELSKKFFGETSRSAVDTVRTETFEIKDEQSGETIAYCVSGDSYTRGYAIISATRLFLKSQYIL